MTTDAGDEQDPRGGAGAGEGSVETLAEPTAKTTALLGEAANKSAIVWIDIPDDRSFPVWYAWDRDRFYAVSGEGEQLLPPLPEVVHVILRSKDSGGRLLTVTATAHLLAPHTDSWESATDALAGERLNATDDVKARWAEAGSVYALHPFGPPLTAPGSQPQDSGRVPLTPAPATTLGRRPWHLGRS